MFGSYHVLEGEERRINPEERANGSSATKPAPPKRKVVAHLSEGMLENNRMKKPRSVWDVLISFIAHSAIVVALILIPLLYTNALNLPEYQRVFLAAPPPPPPPPPAAAPRTPRIPRKTFFEKDKLHAPKSIPKHIAQIKERAEPAQPLQGVVGGVPGGVPGGVLGGTIGGVLSGVRGPLAPPKRAVPRGPIRVGGNVRPPQLIRKIQPMYPPLARETRTQGDVVIECVIDQAGDVRQMKLISGHPLLVSAAMSAVREWKYQPTLLNGKPVAVEMSVTVHFSLGNG